MDMTSVERMNRFLQRKPHDRIPVFEHFWSDTHTEWAKKGKIKEGTNLKHYFDYDMTTQTAFNVLADIDFVEQVIEETEDTIMTINGNGATFRRHKKHDATPEHVDFSVIDRASWNAIKDKLKPDPRRINFKAYAEEKEWAAANGRFFCLAGANVFERMAGITGHEHMLIGMALDPEWIHDMAGTYAELTINLMEELFLKEGKPDGIWFYEDMGFKERPFMSPAMYNEIIKPYHKMIINYTKSQGLPVIMHSCGFVEPLIPGIIEAGIDCLQVIEVKAGMNLKRIYDNYGEVLSFMGGMDVRELYSNDRDRVLHELKSKLPYITGHNGYALHSDHSIPKTVDIETYEYFMEQGMELGSYN